MLAGDHSVHQLTEKLDFRKREEDVAVPDDLEAGAQFKWSAPDGQTVLCRVPGDFVKGNTVHVTYQPLMTHDQKQKAGVCCVFFSLLIFTLALLAMYTGYNKMESAEKDSQNEGGFYMFSGLVVMSAIVLAAAWAMRRPAGYSAVK